MSKEVKIFETKFRTEDGGIIENPSVVYHQWGEPKEDGSNIVWVCHALTANSDVFEWWPGLFSESSFFNPKEWCIICPNILGSCYGSSGPLERNEASGKLWYYDFPELTIRDMVSFHQLLAEHLGYQKISVLIGASLGGQQALEWAVLEPDKIGNLILIATNAIHSAWGVGLNETQRMAIEADSTWGQEHPKAGSEGLKVARALALHSYRNYDAYEHSQPRKSGEDAAQLRVKSYQRYQGTKLANRFNPISYYRLSQAMDSHDIGRDRGSIEKALQQIRSKTLVLAMENDVLFPKKEQEFIANHIEKASFFEIPTRYGHDGFLLETKALEQKIKEFLKNQKGSFTVLN